MKRITTFLWLVLWMSAAPTAQDPVSCPQGLPSGASCFAGRDNNGAYYLIAIPKNWNNGLVLYDHGGPSLSPARPLTSAGSLGARQYELLQEGFAIAATSYRTGGWTVGDGAADTENLRQIFVRQFGRPQPTIVHGISYGGIVSAMVPEFYGVGPDGTRNYDGALPLCGLVAGTRRFGYLYLDLRVVYQYYCQNHPRPSESPYDLYLGLAPGTTMTAQDLNARVNECTGVQLPAEQRTETQRRNLANILNVIRIPQGNLLSHMSDATFALRDMVQAQLNGRNPFPNLDVTYSGSTDDGALNEGVRRYASDPDAVAWLSADSDPAGAVAAPLLTMHAVNDGIVFVENESAYRETFEKAGTSDYLFQTYTSAGGHCGFTAPEFETVFHALLDWIDTGNRPSPADVVPACETYRALYGGQCRFNPDYQPNAYESRVPARTP